MIRLAAKKDIPIINEIGESYIDNFIKKYNIEEYLNNENYIILLNENAYINSFLIVYKNIDYYELLLIIVEQKNRNKKIGSMLLGFFINNYTKKNTILLEVAVNNIYAIKLYKKYNFEIIHTREKYYNNIDAYVMKRVVK